MIDGATTRQHAFNHAPAALRIFRFAADSVPRVLELAHVSAFLRECAVEFGSADAALPAAMSNWYASGWYFTLRDYVLRDAACCPWLAEKLLACRSGAPVPAAALAPDVTRHDVNWGAEGARRDNRLVVSSDGSKLTLSSEVNAYAWVQGAVGVRSGKHYFSLTGTKFMTPMMRLGWVDRTLGVEDDDELGPGHELSAASGATFTPWIGFHFGTAPLEDEQCLCMDRVECPCTLGCLLDLDAGAMTVFVDGEPLPERCEYKFPTDRAWYKTVGLNDKTEALFSTAV
jgi:hypothetical protein